VRVAGKPANKLDWPAQALFRPLGAGYVEGEAPTEGHGACAQGKRDCSACNGNEAGAQAKTAGDDSRGGNDRAAKVSFGALLIGIRACGESPDSALSGRI
jgi:hypothetical protein